MSKRMSWLLVVAIGLTLSAAVKARESRQANSRAMVLTALDYIEIQQLVAT